MAEFIDMDARRVYLPDGVILVYIDLFEDCTTPNELYRKLDRVLKGEISPYIRKETHDLLQSLCGPMDDQTIHVESFEKMHGTARLYDDARRCYVRLCEHNKQLKELPRKQEDIAEGLLELQAFCIKAQQVIAKAVKIATEPGNYETGEKPGETGQQAGLPQGPVLVTLDTFIEQFCEPQSNSLRNSRKLSLLKANRARKIQLPQCGGNWKSGQAKRFRSTELLANWSKYRDELPNLPALKPLQEQKNAAKRN